MADRVLLYISAASDLALEREVLSRAITEIPTSLGWRITQTPIGDEPLDLEAAAQADLHLLILGGDIRAPVGVEWLAARRAGRIPTLFLKAPTTPRLQRSLSMTLNVTLPGAPSMTPPICAAKYSPFWSSTS